MRNLDPRGTCNLVSHAPRTFHGSTSETILHAAFVPSRFGFSAPLLKPILGHVTFAKHYLAGLPVVAQSKWDGLSWKYMFMKFPKWLQHSWCGPTPRGKKIPQPGGIVVGPCGSGLMSYSRRKRGYMLQPLSLMQNEVSSEVQPNMFCPLMPVNPVRRNSHVNQRSSLSWGTSKLKPKMMWRTKMAVNHCDNCHI